MWSSRASDSNYGESLRRRERRTVGDRNEDKVLAGKMQGAQISSSRLVGSGASVCAPSRPADSFGGSSEAGSRRGTLSTSSSILSVDSSPSSSFGSLEAAGAPLDSSLLCSHKYSEKELALLSQISSSTKNTVKVLCSYGGSFVDSSTAEGGKVYHGGTTRLLSIELTRETSHGKLITQLAQAWLAGNNVDSSTSHDEISPHSLSVHYELPGEQRVFVALLTDDDLSNMYEEWVTSKLGPGPVKKLRLFIESVSAQMGSSGGSQPNAAGSDAALAQLPESDDIVLDSIPIMGHGEGGGSKPSMFELIENRMEVIQKSDVAVSKLLGAGGYGEVYLGKWRDATDVAVKCLSPALLTTDGDLSSISPTHVKELLDEARLLFSLRHPNVVWVYGIVLDQPGDESDNRFRCPAIIAEYMASGSLHASLSRHDQTLKHGWIRVVIALDAARGMEYLHSKHIVHFDLKSGNLLLAWRDRRPTCKVADFGLSKQRRQTYVSGVKPHTGTLPWMAPEILKTPNCVGDKVVVGIALITPPGEQHRFRPYRGRFSALLSHPVPAAFWPTAHVPQADIYSFGIVMWELWTSLEPYAGMHYANLLHQRMTEPNLRPPVPGTPAWEEGSSASPEEPAPGWRQLMESCWSEDPSGRPPFTEIVTRLKEMVDAVKPNRKKATDD